MYTNMEKSDWYPRCKPVRANLASLQERRRAATRLRGSSSLQGDAADTFNALELFRSDSDEFGSDIDQDSDSDGDDDGTSDSMPLSLSDERGKLHVLQALHQCQQVDIVAQTESGGSGRIDPTDVSVDAPPAGIQSVFRSPSRESAEMLLTAASRALRSAKSAYLHNEVDGQDSEHHENSADFTCNNSPAGIRAYILSLQSINSKAAEENALHANRLGVNQRVHRFRVGLLRSRFPAIVNDVADHFMLNEEQRLAYYIYAEGFLKRLRGQQLHRVRIYFGGGAGTGKSHV